MSPDFLELSVQFSRSVVSDSLWPHELQNARPPCPSPTPGVNPDSRPLSQPRLTSIESVMPSSHLILCHPVLLLPPVPPSIRVFFNESALLTAIYRGIYTWNGMILGICFRIIQQWWSVGVRGEGRVERSNRTGHRLIKLSKAWYWSHWGSFYYSSTFIYMSFSITKNEKIDWKRESKKINSLKEYLI